MSNVVKIEDGSPMAGPPISGSALNGGDGGGTYDGMEARLKRLEEDGKELRQDLKVILRDLSEIKGRVNAMPTTWQMVGFVVALALGIFTIVRVTLPI